MSETIPCDRLTEQQLTHRLAGFMFVSNHHGVITARLHTDLATKKRTPGYCVVCGTKLAVTWRAIKCLVAPSEANPDGSFKIVEADHSPDALAKVEAFNAAHPPDKWGLQNGFWNWPVTSCEAISQDAFNRAKAYLLEERHKAAKDKPIDASEERRRKAAQRVGGS